MQQSVLQQKPLSDGARAAIMTALTFALAAVFLLLASPVAENNDDFFLGALLGGAYGEPSEYTIYLNLFFSRFIVFLNGAAPAVNWLAALQYFFIAAAFAAIASLIWILKPDFLGFSVALALCVYIAPQYYTLMQYTKYAVVIGAAGVLCVLFSLRKGVSLAPLAIGFVLCIFSSFLRFPSFAAALACAAVPCADALFASSKRLSAAEFFKSNRRYFIVFAALLASVGALYAASNAVYRSDAEAAEQLEYGRARTAVSDYELAPYDLYYDEYQALGISRNDLEVINTWSFTDLEKFDAETLNAIAELSRGADGGALGRFLSAIEDFTVTKPPFWGCAALFVLALIFCERRARLAAAASFASYFALVLALCFAGRITRWVCLGLLAGVLFSLAYILASGLARDSKITRAVVPAFVCAASAALFALHCAPMLTPAVEASAGGGDALEIYSDAKLDGELLYLADMFSMPEAYKAVGTFERCPEGLYEGVYTLGGWDALSPAKNTLLASHNIEGSPYRALVERDDVFLLDALNYESKITYLRQNYSESANASLYSVLDGIYVFAFADAPDSPAVDDVISVEDFSVTLSEINGSFYQYNVIASSDKEAASAYISLESGEESRVYRMNIARHEHGLYYLSAGIPIIDLVDMGEKIAARVILKMPDGTVFISPER